MEVRQPETDPELVENIRAERAKIGAENEHRWADLDEKIIRAATSWNKDYPGRKELPRWAAVICQIAVMQAARDSARPIGMLQEAARLRARLPEEIMDYLIEWEPDDSKTTIQVRRATRDLLSKCATHGETYDDVIRRLL